MTDTSSHRTSLSIWIPATVSAFIGAALLYDAQPGINWPIWIASAALAVILAGFFSGNPITLPSLLLLSWACLLSVALALTSNPQIRVLIIASDLMLLGLAVIVTRTQSWGSLSAKLLPAVPFLAPFRVWRASLREVAGVPRSISSARASPVVRGLLITIPIVIVLLALLRTADPVIGWIADRLAAVLPEWSFSGRVLFFFFLLSVTLGAAAIFARQSAEQLPALPAVSVGTRVGATEQKMLLISVTTVLW
ncbi:MAG: DUF4153 domain-containing protein, partial [Gemmatimonadaceae bacterium]